MGEEPQPTGEQGLQVCREVGQIQTTLSPVTKNHLAAEVTVRNQKQWDRNTTIQKLLYTLWCTK